MDYRKVTAIIRRDVLEKVELKLQEMGVRGISVTRVKGYGEYLDFYFRDWLVSLARIEIFIALPVKSSIGYDPSLKRPLMRFNRFYRIFN